MIRADVTKAKSLEGRQVGVALVGGSRMDDCQLVCAGWNGVKVLWVFTNGEDAFIPLREVIEIWEAPTARSRFV